MWTQQQQQLSHNCNKITLILHFRDEEMPLIVYRGTSEQAIHENIRELTNLYRFKCFNEQQQPIILSSNLPNEYHVYIQDPTVVNDKEDEESDEPSAEEQVEYLKAKIHQVIDAKSVLNVFKSMLIVLESPPPPLPPNEDDEKNEDKSDDATASDPIHEDKNEEQATETEETVDAQDPPVVTDETDEKKDESEATKTDQDEEQLQEQDDPSVIKYDGKYKDLVAQMEAKQHVLQQIILKTNDLTDDLFPPKPEPQEQKEADSAVNAEQNEEDAHGDDDDALLQRLVSKLEPNLQTQIQQMQQLLQMQQTTMMAMLAAGGGAAVPAGADGLLGPRTPIPRISIGFGAQQPTQLAQSQTEATAEAKEEEKEERSSELKVWFGGSKLVEDDEYETLLSFFAEKGRKVKSMERVYRASEEDYDALKFHDKCDDVGPTLVIIQSEHSHVFGGFTMTGWKDESANHSGMWKADPDAFIFILRHPKDDVLPERWMVLPEKKEKTIRCDRNYGPVFGYGYDIRICTECDQKKDSSSQLDNEDACFGAPQDDDFLTGEFYFLVKDYEVYKVSM
eukprot:162515_1